MHASHCLPWKYMAKLGSSFLRYSRPWSHLLAPTLCRSLPLESHLTTEWKSSVMKMFCVAFVWLASMLPCPLFWLPLCYLRMYLLQDRETHLLDGFISSSLEERECGGWFDMMQSVLLCSPFKWRVKKTHIQTLHSAFCLLIYCKQVRGKA